MDNKLTNNAKDYSYRMELLKNILEYISEQIESVSTEWGELEEMYQDYDWVDGKREPKFNEDGTPKMVHREGRVPKNKLTDDDKMKIESYNKVADNLFKMLLK